MPHADPFSVLYPSRPRIESTGLTVPQPEQSTRQHATGKPNSQRTIPCQHRFVPGTRQGMIAWTGVIQPTTAIPGRLIRPASVEGVPFLSGTVAERSTGMSDRRELVRLTALASCAG